MFFFELVLIESLFSREVLAKKCDDSDMKPDFWPVGDSVEFEERCVHLGIGA